MSIPKGARGNIIRAEFQIKYATTKLKAVVTASANWASLLWYVGRQSIILVYLVFLVCLVYLVYLVYLDK